MSLASSTGDITLNSKKYFLIEESYRKKAQQPFNPRFSTGDPSLSDLSFWQFVTQETWDGGAGQKIFSTVNKIRESAGWSFLNGRPELSGGAINPGTSVLSSIYDDANLFLPRALPFGKSNDRMAIAWIFPYTAVNALPNAAKTTQQSATALLPLINTINSVGAEVWQRPGDAAESALICTKHVAGPTYSLDIYDNDFNVVTNVVLAANHRPRAVIGITGEKFLAVGGYGAAPSDFTTAYVQPFAANSWTAGTILYSFISEMNGEVVPVMVKDSNGSIYFATANINPASSGTDPLNSDHCGSAVGIFTATDVVNTAGPMLSELVRYPNFFITSLVSINGTVYIFGARILRVNSTTASNTYRNEIIKYPNTVIWQSEKIHTDSTTQTYLNKAVRAVSQVSGSEALFVVENNLSSSYASIMRLRIGDIVEEVAGFPYAPTDSVANNGWASLIQMNGSIWVFGLDGRYQRSRLDKSLARLPTSGTSILKLSDFGGNTPLINKTLYSVIVELSEAITSGETLTVKVNDTSVGTITNSDGTRKEIILTTEITASKFTPTLEMAGTSTWPGGIEKLTLRYIPTQFKKKAWAFGIRATKNLKRGDGTAETKTTTTMFSDIESAWTSNVPITFVDIDGSSYTVIVTDYDMRQPLIDRRGGLNLEALIFVELLEV